MSIFLHFHVFLFVFRKYHAVYHDIHGRGGPSSGDLYDTVPPDTILFSGNTLLYITISMVGVVPPLVISMIPYHLTCMLFVPIMGRSGTDIIPDIPIGVLTSLIVIIASQYFVSIFEQRTCSFALTIYSSAIKNWKRNIQRMQGNIQGVM